MRIGHYAPHIGEEGGIATYIHRMGHAQSNRGHRVAYLGRNAGSASLPGECVDIPSDTKLFEAAEDLSLDILHLHKSVDPLPADRVPTVRTIHGHQGGCPSGSRYLSRSEEPCDRAYSVGGCLWGHIVDRCGSVRPHNLKKNFTRIHRELDQAKHVPTYTVSDFLREQMLRAGCAPEHVQTIPSPAPQRDEPFSPVPRTTPPRFLYLGRLVPEKGLDWLLRALSHVSVPIHLDVAGKGPRREALKKLTRELGIDAQVTFHGWVDSDRVPALMRRARAIVFPSVWHEPAGLISLEAAAYGRPLIASRVGGIPEYADESHAILVDVRDVEGLAEALTRLAQDADCADRRGRNGREVARSKFSVAQFLDRVDAFYEHAHPSISDINSTSNIK